MSNRTYLSIGDVLTLLREEFPDVTISKIRFLESQGLVNPERSPSGYRKFFEHDVERLRWVLRQQREHFLPLKVIRDRLEDGELEALGADLPNGKPARHAPTQAAATVSAVATVQVEQDKPTKADQEAMARILADASRRTARRPDEVLGSQGPEVVAELGGRATGSPTASASKKTGPDSAGAGGARGGRGTGGDGGRNGTPTTGPEGERAASGRSGPSETGDGTATPPAVAPAPAGATKKASGRTSRATVGETTGASLTLRELCSASGLSADEVAGLQSFGLIESVSVAGIETFDEDAVTVANLAAAFRVYGIEPRHLRLYRNAVDREFGLIEQVVIPLLRQRNPEARQRAVEGADELASLGESMRTTLLRLALRQHLGG